MPTFIALLRGINVGGHGLISMVELREFLESLGCTGVKTLLQSGNVVFQSKSKSIPALQQVLEKKTAERWGGPIDYVIRAGSEWISIVGRNPYSDEAAKAPAQLGVMFFKEEPSAERLAQLKSALAGPEYFEACGRELFIFYPHGMGKSRFTSSFIERKLSVRGTVRNWNTVQKLAALVADT